MKKTATSGLDKFGPSKMKSPFKQKPVETKTDWFKIIGLIIKLLEPEIRKMKGYQMIAPLFLFFCLGLGVFKSVEFAVESLTNLLAK